ncbi:MAG: hypothetical protein QOH29_969 [Actinomycetota bacterium]|jgi:hypothetical protein|nr:hypothetical protein [Actinomycetota bacterium]
MRFGDTLPVVDADEPGLVRYGVTTSARNQSRAAAFGRVQPELTTAICVDDPPMVAWRAVAFRQGRTRRR